MCDGCDLCVCVACLCVCRCGCVCLCVRVWVFSKKHLTSFVLVFCGFVIRVRDWFGDGFEVRDRVSVRARGGLGFIHYSPNLLE